MKAPGSVTTPAQYLASLPPDRREIVSVLHAAILKAAPDLEAYIGYGMLGYRLAAGKTNGDCAGDEVVAGLGSQKHHVSLYICISDKDGYLVENAKDRLGRVSVGKGCIRLRKLEDLNLKVAMELMKKAARLAGEAAGFAT